MKLVLYSKNREDSSSRETVCKRTKCKKTRYKICLSDVDGEERPQCLLCMKISAANSIKSEEAS
jgi:hypothetical protein